MSELNVWYSNFEADPAVTFEKKAPVKVGADGTFTLTVAVGDFWTVFTGTFCGFFCLCLDSPSNVPQGAIVLLCTLGATSGSTAVPTWVLSGTCRFRVLLYQSLRVSGRVGMALLFKGRTFLHLLPIV